jgi:hypothetical protein
MIYRQTSPGLPRPESWLSQRDGHLGQDLLKSRVDYAWQARHRLRFAPKEREDCTDTVRFPPGSISWIEAV